MLVLGCLGRFMQLKELNNSRVLPLKLRLEASNLFGVNGLKSLGSGLIVGVLCETRARLRSLEAAVKTLCDMNLSTLKCLNL